MLRLCARITPLWSSKISKQLWTQNLQIRMFNQEMTQGWPQSVVEFLRRENLTEPTQIQQKTLPKTMLKKDLVGIARTGSGKTLAFVIPAVMHVLEKRQDIGSRNRDITCLVLAPTRELANQTAGVVSKFSSIKSQILVGGQSRLVQVDKLSKKDVDIAIATPGRLIDLIQTNDVDLSKVTYLVLDEADRMLDMGFEPQIRSIIEKLPKERQTVMWSATWPDEIKNLARDFMQEYEHIAIDGTELKANPNIKQIVEVCPGHQKFDIMMDHIKKFEVDEQNPKILIFASTQRMVDQLEYQLMKSRIRSVSMHGRRTQLQRDRALDNFRSNRCRVMVATDVAARGLDIRDVTHVFNFDFPQTIEDYIHRIGRTARHTSHGVSVTLLTEDDMAYADDLIKVLKETDQEIPDELEQLSEQSLRSHLAKKRSSRDNRRNNSLSYISRIRQGGGSQGKFHDRDNYRDSYSQHSHTNYREDFRSNNRGDQRNNYRGSNYEEKDFDSSGEQTRIRFEDYK